MNPQLEQYVSPDAAFNISYSEAEKLVSRLRTLGVVVTNIQAIPNPGNAPYLSVNELRDLGMKNADELDYGIQVNSGSSWNTAALVADDLSPMTAQAVYKVMSDLVPGDAQAATANALMLLPGIDDLVSKALA